MGKKRKAGKLFGESTDIYAIEKPSKLNIKTYEDVADSEDEFLLNRDKVLLDEGPELKRRRTQREKDEFLEQNEEALNYAETSESEDDFEDNDLDNEEGEDLEEDAVEVGDDHDNRDWGQSKSDYYGANDIEGEEDALEEEAEALRLQKQQLQSMTDADYGFDESEWVGDGKSGKDRGEEGDDIVTEVLPQLQITDSMSSEERLKVLKSRYPEFDHLSKELVELQPLYNQLSVSAVAAKKFGVAPNSSRLMVKYQALASYLSSIAMYFALMTSSFSEDKSAITAKSPKEVHEHPVIDTLVKCRTLWQRVEDLPTEDDDAGLVEVDEAEDVLGDEIMEESLQSNKDVALKKTSPSKKKSKAEKAAEKAQVDAATRRAERKLKTEADLAALSSLSTLKPQKSTAQTTRPKPSAVDDSDLGDELDLTAEELAERAKRKKSLKFYTSQIAQKANKRSSSRRDYGGDIDVPHRERLRDRQQRLNAEAVKRGKNQVGDALGGESDDEDRRVAREIRGDDMGDEDDEYYDMVAARNKKRKFDKADRAEAFAQAAREGGMVVEEEVVGEDGKRAITYAISKNKGLTPKRKKDVRNPRVKKRKKYDEKKKKLKSMKPVYGGGEGKGGYQGELTGIKKGLVKSVKL